MRSKEEAHDYRYFPEPDLPPLELDPVWTERLKHSLPELPHAKLSRFVAEFGLSEDDALQLTATVRTAHYFEECARLSGNPRASANWIMGDLTYALKSSGKEVDACPVTPPRLASLLRIVDSGKISGKIAKTVFEQMFASGEEPAAVIDRLGLEQISDASSLLPLIEKVKAAHPKELADYRAGKEKLLAFFVGQIMKETRGQASPKVLNDLLPKALRQ